MAVSSRHSELKRAVSFLLAIVMLVSLASASVFAEDADLGTDPEAQPALLDKTISAEEPENTDSEEPEDIVIEEATENTDSEEPAEDAEPEESAETAAPDEGSEPAVSETAEAAEPEQAAEESAEDVNASLTSLNEELGASGLLLGSSGGARGNLLRKISALRTKFPAGKYWNHYAPNGDEATGYMVINSWYERYADTVTDSPCASHDGTPIPCYDCNNFDGAIQCCGFARKLFYDVFGVRVSEMITNYGKRRDVENLSVGDFVSINNDAHYAFVISVSKDSFTAAECNGTSYNQSDYCVIRWDHEYAKSKISYFVHASNYDAVNVPFVIASGTCPGGLVWKVDDEDTLTVSGSGRMGPITSYVDEQNHWPWSGYLDSIRSVVVADGVTSIGEWAFSHCVNLTSVVIADSVTTIGAYAFAECDSLTRLYIPKGVKTIGYRIFDWCTKLTGIDVSPENPYYFSKDGVLYDRDGRIIFLPAGMETIRYPDTIPEIVYSSFYNCRSIKTLILPSTVEKVSGSVLGELPGLTSIEISGDDSRFLSVDGALFKRNSAPLLLAKAAGAVPDSELVWVTRTKSGAYSVPNGVTSIGDSAFSGCSGLTEIVLPNGVTSIGDSSFSSCAGLEAFTIPVSVARIGKSAFYSCRCLADIAIPDGVTAIERYTFAYCSALKSIFIPKSVKSIGEYAFLGCESISEVYYTGSEEQWNGIQIEPNNDGLTKADIHFAPTDIAFDREYAVLSVGDSFELGLMNIDEIWKDALEWSVVDADLAEESDILSVDKGTVTANSVGTAYVAASVSAGEESYSAWCRVDVTAEPVAQAVEKVSLVESKASVEVFSTDYPRIDVLLEMQQLILNAAMSADSKAAPFISKSVDPGLGIAIEGAVFADSRMAELFRLRVCDDRTLEIIPTEQAIANAKKLGSSYKSAVTVTVDGVEFTTPQTLTLSVKKTVPKLKAAKVSFNSYLDYDIRQIKVTGPSITSFEAVSLPEWMELNRDMSLSMLEGAPAKKSGTVRLNTTLDGWVGTYPLTVGYSIASAVPKLTFAKSTITMYTKTGGGYAVPIKSITPAEFSQYRPEFVEVREGKISYGNNTVLNCRLQMDYSASVVKIRGIRLDWGPDAPTDNKAHTYKVYYELAGKTFCFTVSVPKPTAPKMTLKTSGQTEAKVDGSPATVSASFSKAAGPYAFCRSWYISDKNGNLSPDADKFTIIGSDSSCQISADPYNMPAPGTYYVTGIGEYSTGFDFQKLQATVKFSVKNTAASKLKAKATLKASGSIDVIRPQSALTVTASFKNFYNYKLDADSLKIYTLKNKTYVPCEDFLIRCVGTTFTVTANGPLDPNAKYYAKLTAGKVLSSGYTAIKVTMGSAKLTADVKTVSMPARDCYSKRILQLQTTDFTLSEIEKVTLDAASLQWFRLIELSGGRYALGYKDNTLPAGFKAGTTKTVKLNVFLKGNETAKSNAAVSVKVNIK